MTMEDHVDVKVFLFVFDDAFFNRTGLECVGVVRPEPGLLLD